MPVVECSPHMIIITHQNWSKDHLYSPKHKKSQKKSEGQAFVVQQHSSKTAATCSTSCFSLTFCHIVLCVIFTILVSFSRDNALFASKAKINVFWKAKINVFWNFFKQSGPEGASGVKKKFPKTLILAFEVIVQLPEYRQWRKKVRPKSRKSHIVI